MGLKACQGSFFTNVPEKQADSTYGGEDNGSKKRRNRP